MRVFFALAAVLIAISTSLPAAPTKPNVVYILSDDVGWGDLSLHGGGVPTPNIDRLFARGVELTQFMRWCVYSPTRAMLLTGRHSIRVGTAPEVGGDLDLDGTTIAEGFKANGSRTGVFGKWHNGNNPDTPEYRAAFDEAGPRAAWLNTNDFNDNTSGRDGKPSKQNDLHYSKAGYDLLAQRYF